MVTRGRGCWGEPWAALCPYRADGNLTPCTSVPCPPDLSCPAPQGPEARGAQAAFLYFPTDYSTMQAVQATMILSTILCCIAFLIFLLQLFRLKQGERFVLTSIIQLLSCK